MKLIESDTVFGCHQRCSVKLLSSCAERMFVGKFPYCPLRCGSQPTDNVLDEKRRVDVVKCVVI